MTARDVLRKAMIMLGYIGSNGELSGEQEFLRRGIVAINQVYSDLWYRLGRNNFIAIDSSDSEINLPERILNDVMPYGVAMFIAQSEDDGDSQQIMAATYNKKRADIRRENYIADVIPRSYDL